MTASLLLVFAFLPNQVLSQNIYPNYQPGAESVVKYATRYGEISRKGLLPILPLEVNGKIRQGTVRSKWAGHHEGNNDLYEFKVLKEGVLSIQAKPISYDNKRGMLSLDVFGNDNRMTGGTVIRRMTQQSQDRYRRDDGWSVTDSYSFYAYPGTYYLQIDGKSGDDPGKYRPLTYQVGIIQDGCVNSYSGDLGKDIEGAGGSPGSRYPNFLGKTVLKDSISIVSSVGLENWLRKSKDSLLAKKSAGTNTNSRDDFWFTPSTSGKVYFHLSTFSSDAMDVWQRAYRKARKDSSVLPQFDVSVMHQGVKTHQLVKKQSSFDGSLDVVAGGNYKVSIASSEIFFGRPCYYRLYISYSEKVPPLETALAERSDGPSGTTSGERSDDRSDATSGEIASGNIPGSRPSSAANPGRDNRSDDRSGTTLGELASGNNPGTQPSSLVTPTLPHTGMLLRVESKTIGEGESTTVPVWLHRAANLANINFELTYKPEVATASKVSKGKFLTSKTAFESNAGDAGIIRIGFAGKDDLTGTGPIAYIPFTAVGKAGTTTPLTLNITTTSSAANREPIVSVVNGFIKIADANIPGDSNGSGELDSGDALDALKMSVKLIPENPAADIDRDGKVTSTDARLILEKVVNQQGGGE